MNPHDRIRAALEHEEPDRVPTLAQYLEKGFIKQVKTELPIAEKARLAFKRHALLDHALHVGFDSIWLHYGRTRADNNLKPEVPREVREKYGVGTPDIWGHYSEHGWYQNGVLKTPELIDEWIGFVNTCEAGQPKDYDHFARVWEKYIDKGIVPIPTGGSVSWVTWSAIGLDRFAYMARKHLGRVKELAMAFGRLTKKMHDEHFERGVDMVFICDDFCMKQRPIYSPKLFDEIIVPVYTMLAKNAHSKGAKLLIHSDGNVSELLPGLVKSGVDAIEPLEYEAGARIAPLKREFGTQITFIGNVPATDVLTFGTVEDTVAITKQQLKDHAPGGGYVLGAGSDILGTCKLENVKAMIETVKKHGTYPIE